MKKIMHTILMPVVLTLLLFAMGAKPQDWEKFRGKPVKIQGVLSVVGNEPFTRMGVRTRDGYLVYLSDQDKRRYNNLIAEEVDAEGVLRVETIFSADRKKKFREFSLSNAVLKKAEPVRLPAAPGATN